MNSGGLVLILFGVWLLTQVFAGDMLRRLTVLK